MSDDAELDAMASIKAAMERLDPDARTRVIWWITQKFDIELRRSSGDRSGAGGKSSSDNDADSGEGPKFEDFADLYDAVGPATDRERVLVAAYWMHKTGESTFGSLELNKMLKDLGHPVSEMAKAMQWNIDNRPALILQLRKSGSSRQARKTYKLTAEGSKWVEARMTS